MNEVRVFCSGAFKAAHVALVPGFEAANCCRVLTAWGSSVAGSPTSIPARMQHNEPVDVVIMSGDGLAQLADAGKIVPGTLVELARSGIGVAVQRGAARPAIGSAEALKSALMACQSIAISASASGIHLRKLFETLGIAEAISGKLLQAEGEPVGSIVARGEAAIGFQQMSELLPVAGIDLVGPLPPELQKRTVFSAGIAMVSKEVENARNLIAFLAGPQAHAAIEASGMEPASLRIDAA